MKHTAKPLSSIFVTLAGKKNNPVTNNHYYKIPLQMKSLIFLFLAFLSLNVNGQTADEILKKVDQNISSKNRIFESSMTIHGKRVNRTITSKTYSIGIKQSFTEYYSPARERGTKMLKLEDRLWIYSPSSDRTIQLSGQLLRQSLMGSDLSYEDMMEDRKLTELYIATVLGQEQLNGRKVYLLGLTAKVPNTAYHTIKMWIDSQRFVPLKEELFAKSGQLLKRIAFSNVKKVQGRWFPMSINFKDVLKHGHGTTFNITSIKFDQRIPAYIFTKASLKK